MATPPKCEARDEETKVFESIQEEPEKGHAVERDYYIDEALSIAADYVAELAKADKLAGGK